MVASKHNYWLRKSERRIKHRYALQNIIVDTPPLSRSQYLSEKFVSLTFAVYRYDIAEQGWWELAEMCDQSRRCVLARISEFPNVIMLRYACSYRYLSTQNNNNIEVVPNVGRLAIHCHELAIRSIMLMLCCSCIVYSTLSYNILWFYLRLLFLSISCCISHPLHWDPRRMRCI